MSDYEAPSLIEFGSVRELTLMPTVSIKTGTIADVVNAGNHTVQIS